MANHEIKNVLVPSVEFLQTFDRLFLNSSEMAAFLGVTKKVFVQLVYTDRVPAPVQIGYGTCARWSMLELLDWVIAGCPRRTVWHERHGTNRRFRR